MGDRIHGGLTSLGGQRRVAELLCRGAGGGGGLTREHVVPEQSGQVGGSPEGSPGPDVLPSGGLREWVKRQIKKKQVGV